MCQDLTSMKLGRQPHVKSETSRLSYTRSMPCQAILPAMEQGIWPYFTGLHLGVPLHLRFNVITTPPVMGRIHVPNMPAYFE